MRPSLHPFANGAVFSAGSSGTGLLCRIAQQRCKHMVVVLVVLLAILCLHGSSSAVDTAPAVASPPAQLRDFSDVACLENALRLAGQHVDPMALLTNPHWPIRGEPSIENLEMMARDQGASTARFAQLSLWQLAQLTTPVILHLKGSRYSEKADHYVVCTSVRDAQAQLLVPPARTCQVPLELLATRWSGEALAISITALHVPEPGWTERPVARVGVLLLLVMVLIVTGNAYHRYRRHVPAQSWAGEAISGARQSLLLLFLSGTLGLGLRLALGISVLPIASTSLLPDGPDPMEFLVKVDAAGAIVERARDIDLLAAQQAIQQGALLLDAREPHEYTAGHIKGALSCPASDAVHLRLHLAGIARSRQIVVYCASSNCGKGHYLASALLQNGFENVAVYPPGWSTWPGAKESGSH